MIQNEESNSTMRKNGIIVVGCAEEETVGSSGEYC